MQIFYTPDFFSGDSYTLTPSESHHAIQVLRLGAGARIQLIDGRGGFFQAQIVEPSSKGCRVDILERVSDFGTRNYRLHIAIAPTKNIDRYEWFLEKATEIGIDRITPIITDRSERKVVKHDRSEKVILSAVKQSIKAYVPELDEQISLRDFLKQPFPETQLFIAHCDESDSKQEFAKSLTSGGSYLILIGPEGDFSPTEVAAANAAGFKSVSLGEARLRTETAGVMATAIASLFS